MKLCEAGTKVLIPHNPEASQRSISVQPKIMEFLLREILGKTTPVNERGHVRQPGASGEANWDSQGKGQRLKEGKLLECMFGEKKIQALPLSEGRHARKR